MSLVDPGEKGPWTGWLCRCSAVTCSSFHPNCAQSQGHDDIHHHSLPRSKTPAAPVGSVLMKPLPGTGDNPYLQTWSVFFVPEPLHSHSAHFEHFPWTWPDLSELLVILLFSLSLPSTDSWTHFLSSDARFISRAHRQKCWMHQTLEPSLRASVGLPHRVRSPH